MASYYHHTFTSNGTTHTLTVSNGNKKLISTKDVRFIVWNLPAVSTCPYATEHCKQACYALKAEHNYPTAKAARIANYDASKAINFHAEMLSFIHDLMQKPSHKNAKKVFFRIHESGDFYDKRYALMWYWIACELKDVYKNLVFEAYTKSILYFMRDDRTPLAMPENFVLTASVWDDTDPELKELSFRNWKVYTAYYEKTVDALVKSGKYLRCRCSDCATCQQCYTNKVKKPIACVIH